jgi:methyl-accepting chemotaxis protein
MREKLEFKILGIGFTILIIGIAVSSFITLRVQKDTIYDLAVERVNTLVEVIMKNIERSMMQASAELTGQMIQDIKSTTGIESIDVYSWEGREAFKPGSPAKESEILRKLSETRSPFSFMEKDSITFWRPLENKVQCQGCHDRNIPVVGAVKVTLSLKKEYLKITHFIELMLFGALMGMAVLGVVFWQILRRLVILPIKNLEGEAKKMAEGDLSFSTTITTRDEIGKLNNSIRESLYSISGIIKRVKEVAGRILKASDSVEKDSDKIFRGTQKEAEAVVNISSSIEQMNAAITEIAESTEGLASSVEETAASIEEMTSSIENVASITHELSSGVDSTSSSIEQLSATLKEVATNAGELAEVSEETLTAVEEIIASIKEVETSAKESARLSEKTTGEASTFGANSINKTMEGMSKIKVSVEATSEAIRKLGGRSEEIGKILSVINEITEQTTLLALNAAILAAQAGERGKGFSVVADEIKDLTERTTFSTQEIASLIQSVQLEVKEAINLMKGASKSVDDGIALTKDAGDSFKKILDSSKRSSEMARSIEGSTAEQGTAAKHVSESVERVRSMVGQIAKATSEQFKGITLIMKATEKMRDASYQVATATEQQAMSSKQISQAIEMVSEKTQQISSALNEQKTGSDQIFKSIESIKDIPRENRDISFNVNKVLRELTKDAEFMEAEITRFKLFEDKQMFAIKMGIVPLMSPADMYKRFSPLVNYLGQRIGKKVELKVAPDFETAVRDIGEGVTQLCYMTPSTYIEAHRKYGTELLVKFLRDGKPFQHSVIISKADSNIEFVRQLKGRSFAFGDMHSTSSHIVPRGMLLKEGIDLKDLSYYNFLGHHDDVVKAVLNGEFDAGGVMESAANKFKHEGLKFLAVSDDIPEFNICFNSAVESEAPAIKAALMEMNDMSAEHVQIIRAIDKNYTGFSDATDEDYNNVRLMMSKMGLL